MANDAVAKPDTLEEQISQFKGFSTQDGEVVADKRPTGLEKPAAAKQQQRQPAAQARAAAPARDEETEEQDDAESDVDGEAGDDARSAGEGGEENQETQPNARPKRSVQNRINKAVRAQRAAERERDDLRARLAATPDVRAAAQLTAPAASASNADTDGAPDPSKFEFGELDAKYIRALARFEAKQEFAEQTKNQQTTQLTAAQHKEAQRFQGLKATFEDVGHKEYGDEFQELVVEGAANGEWPLSDTVARLILESDAGHHVAFHLASHPDEAVKVSGLTAMQQAAWFGRQEAKYPSAQDAPNNDDDETDEEETPRRAQRPAPGKTASKAPAPLKNKARGNGSTARNAGESSDFAAFEAAAMRQN